MCPNEEFSDLPVQDLVSLYLAKLMELKVPNGSCEQLHEYIVGRQWVGNHLWGGDCNEFLSKIDQVKDKRKKWCLLWLYITSNFALQTKFVFFPVDGLNCTATADIVYNGLPPPVWSPIFNEKINSFFSKQESNSEGISLCIKNHDEAPVPIDTYISAFYLVPETIDYHFCLQMNNESVRLQSEHAKQLITMCSIWRIFLFIFYLTTNAHSKKISSLYPNIFLIQKTKITVYNVSFKSKEDLSLKISKSS